MVFRKTATLVLLIFTGTFSESAIAQTHEQIIDQCKNSVGRAYVQGCMPKRHDLGACRQAAIAPVRECVRAREQKIANSKAAPAAPTPDKTQAAAAASDAAVLPKAFAAPPRSTADISAILDNEKPDAAKIAERLEDADKEEPKGATAADIAQFYYDRGNARALLGRNSEALQDGLKALETAKNDPRQNSRVRQFVGLQYVAAGSAKEAIAVWQPLVNVGDQPGNRGSMISAAYAIAATLVAMGDVSQADTYARRAVARVQEARGSPHPSWRKTYKIYGSAWEAIADSSRALILEARGQYSEAEQAYRRSEAFRRASIETLDDWQFPPPAEQILLAADESRLAVARVEAKQGRINEAEADARAALLSVLKSQGKYNPQTPKFVLGLASILLEQARYDEAEKLTRSALEIQRTRGVSDGSPTSARILSQLGSNLTSQRKASEAASVYAELDKAVANWDPRQRELLMLNGSRIVALYASGQIDAGISAATEMVKRQTARFGEAHYETASARGTLAVGYARAGRAAEAIREFKFAIPILMAATRENADDDTGSGARMDRLQFVVESYVAQLIRNGDLSDDVGGETFTLVDSVRSHSVQQALSASSARAVAKDPQLAELVRTEQDLGKQIGAQLGTLNNALSLPSNERDEKNVAALNAQIAKLRADRVKARQEINRRFPAYADLIDPRAPTVEQVKATLRDGEAVVSFYLGRTTSFVWAFTRQGPVAFAEVKASASDIERKVRKLREALEPQAATVSDIPPFDLALSYELYGLLLKPVEDGWKQAKSLIVVTNGALGLLPLSVLPTAPVQLSTDEPLFSGYRNVPWLARTHAVTSVPSAAALRTLRQLPEASAARQQLIGFGDPIFSKAQAQEAASESQQSAQIAQATQGSDIAVRGVPLKRRSSPQLEGVNSAELALLPRLPDTAEELNAIAIALEADPSKVLNLGEKANEEVVKTTDLSKFKIIVFATHGLVRGELDGLTQPALAMTAPDVAGVAGDGLLTMEEILALKLDADWVVLSACNTGAGSGAGAEAASGLGRAFFYAGTRALLVTNWSVHSQSARELTSDLFRRQAADPKLSRAEALRQAMNAMIDGPGYRDEKGQTSFSYAHPLFWAPYTIIGDGG
jgi:CHAT domain-containing protein